MRQNVKKYNNTVGRYFLSKKKYFSPNKIFKIASKVLNARKNQDAFVYVEVWPIEASLLPDRVREHYVGCASFYRRINRGEYQFMTEKEVLAYGL